MIKRINQYSLKAKATAGFALVFGIMFLSAGVGLFGLLNNNQQLNAFSDISEEGRIADRIDGNLYASQLAFKKYQTSTNKDYVKQYETILKSTHENINQFMELSHNKDRMGYMENILAKTDEYQKTI